MFGPSTLSVNTPFNSETDLVYSFQPVSSRMAPSSHVVVNALAVYLGCRGSSSPSSESSGLSAGSVLLIVFFCLAAVYVIGGMVLHHRAGASGIELLPHLTFWKGLPSLIADGFRFTFSCGRSVGSSSYQPV